MAPALLRTYFVAHFSLSVQISPAIYDFTRRLKTIPYVKIKKLERSMKDKNISAIIITFILSGENE